MAALNALELGSAHTTALTNPFGMARIPRAGFSLEVKHSTLEAKVPWRYWRGWFQRAKGKHLSKAFVHLVVFRVLRKAQPKPGKAPCLSHYT